MVRSKARSSRFASGVPLDASRLTALRSRTRFVPYYKLEARKLVCIVPLFTIDIYFRIFVYLK